MFVTFEGIDWSGKSTQAELLSEWLRAQGRTVLATRERLEVMIASSSGYASATAIPSPFQ